MQYCDKLFDQTVLYLLQQVPCSPLLCWPLVWSPSTEAIPSCLKILCVCVLWHKAVQYWHCAAGCMWALGPTSRMHYGFNLATLDTLAVLYPSTHTHIHTYIQMHMYYTHTMGQCCAFYLHCALSLVTHFSHHHGFSDLMLYEL